MIKARLVKLGLAAVAGLVVLGIAAPFVDAEGYRARIQAALERALDRKVKVGKVRFNLFTGPGFKVNDVEIADDPSIGIEPLAYVDSLEARVTLGSLFTRKLAFSNLKLKEPSVNLVKNDAGVWNFQLLHATSGVLPKIQVRDGRINFKFGDTKSVFYLSESDLDVTPIDEHRMDVRFSGQPARSDQAAQSFGLLLARGVWKRSENAEAELDVNAELERSAISELAKLFEGRGIGLHGVASSRAHIYGPISKLAIKGDLKLDDIHRWDLMPRGSGWQLNYRGSLDLKSQRLELETAEKDNPGTLVVARFRSTEVLSDPHWAASVDLHDVPAAAFVETARHMGAPLPEGVQVEGKLTGAVGFSRPGGFQGQLAATDATLKLPGAPVMKFQSANVVINGSKIDVGPSTVETESGQTAELTASYDLDQPGLDVTIATAAMEAGELRKGAGIRVPVLGALDQGIWKGTLRYQKSGEELGAWSGEFDVRDTRFEIPGLAEPVRLTSAFVSVGAQRIVVSKMRGRAGQIRFTGDFRSEGVRPASLRIEIPEANIGDIERLLMPTLRRNQGLLARFRLRVTPAPEWLRERRIEGTVRIDQLKVDDQLWHVGRSLLSWNGTSVKLTGIEAKRDEVDVEGQLALDLRGALPHYRLEGKVNDLDYKGGMLGLDGTVESAGVGVELLANARAEGTFEGEDVAFSPEAEFKTVSGAFEWSAPSKLHVKNLQAGQGFDTYTGQGTTQPDGKLLLELTSGRRQVKVAGTPFGPMAVPSGR